MEAPRVAMSRIMTQPVRTTANSPIARR
jgi:hypothetical protein